MSDMLIRKSQGLDRSRRAKHLAVLCAFAGLLALAVPTRAGSPAPGNSTAFNDWVQQVQDDATQSAIQFSFDHFTLSPSYIESGKAFSSDNLQVATSLLKTSSVNVGFISDLLADAKANTFDARAVVRDLQSRVSQERDALDMAKYLGSTMPVGSPDFHLSLIEAAADRVAKTQAQLAQARLTLKQASSYESSLGSEFASAKSDLRQAQADMGGVQRGQFYYNRVAPNVNFAIGAAQQVKPWIDLGEEAFDVMTNPVYRQQRSESAYQYGKLSFDLAKAVAGDAAWAEMLGPPVALFDMAHHADLAYKAWDHNNQAQRLAFGGVLSTANLPRVEFTHDYDYFSGSFRSSQSDGPLSITGSWVARNDLATDRFTAASRYTFNGLETSSGHTLTGYGISWRDRTEQQNPFSVFDFRDNATITETTRRFESYNDSFNGALANQQIQRAEPNVRLGVTNIHLTPAEAQLNQDILKRPPSVVIPPPSPPRPTPNASSNRAKGNSQPQYKGVGMPANVTEQPVDVQSFLED